MDQKMKELFKGYYKLDSNELTSLWESATFIFDTNVLTNLYRYQKSTVDELYNVMETIKESLWLPFHVGLEFQRNRLSVISEQQHLFTQVENKINQSIENLNSSLKSLNLNKRHSVIDPDKFLDEINNLKNTYLSTLSTQKQKSISLNSEDETLKKIENFFDGKIGKPPSDQKEIDSLFKQGEVRYENKIPPGFSDKKEKIDLDDFTFGGITYKPMFGDLIVWNQIKQHVKTKNIKNLIFITDDNKEDWWWIINSEGKKTIGVRPELRDELINESGVNLFNAYNFESFLINAKKYLEIEITDEAIDEVREIYDLDLIKSFNKKFFKDRNYIPYTNNLYSKNQKLLNEIVGNWIIERYPFAKLEKDGYADFVILKGKGKHYFHVKEIDENTLNLDALKNNLVKYTSTMRLMKNTQLTIIFTCLSHSCSVKVSKKLGQLTNLFTRYISAVVGYIDSELIDEYTANEFFTPTAEFNFNG